MWNVRRNKYLFAALGCVAMLTAVGFAADEIDLSSEVDGPTAAAPAEEVTITVTYENHSATDPGASAVNLEFPVGMFMHWYDDPDDDQIKASSTFPMTPSSGSVTALTTRFHSTSTGAAMASSSRLRAPTMPPLD